MRQGRKAGGATHQCDQAKDGTDEVNGCAGRGHWWAASAEMEAGNVVEKEGEAEMKEGRTEAERHGRGRAVVEKRGDRRCCSTDQC